MAVTAHRFGALRSLVAIAAIAALAITSAACGGGAGSASPTAPGSAANSAAPTRPVPATPPLADTPVGRRLTWYLDQLNDGGKLLTAADVTANFNAAFLAQVPAAQMVATTKQLAFGMPFRVSGYTASADGTGAQALFEGKFATYKVSIAVDAAAPNLISGLFFKVTANPKPTTTWLQVDLATGVLAPESSLYACEITASGCRKIYGLHEVYQLGIGSTFKLYVLGELAHQIEAGKASWDETLAIRDDWKSLPSGTMQNEPAGTKHTLLEYAQKMISISDNTAADHLLHRLGRANVTSNLTAMGMADPTVDMPFLTTREAFVLKATGNADLRTQYLATAGPNRLKLLEGPVAARPLGIADLADWTKPRDINYIEWFAGTKDLCLAMASLHRTAEKPGLSQVQDILAINPAIDVDPSIWTYVGYKGGSEPGVLNMTWLLRRADNRWFAVSLTLNDPTTAADHTLELLGLGGTAMSLLGVEK